MSTYTDDEKKYLIDIARASIASTLDKSCICPCLEPANPKLRERRAVFVTLKLNNNLRGCIGQMVASDPLYVAVAEMAKAAAFNDYRFKKITRSELGDVVIEISILTPMQKIISYKEINLGIDGVWIRKGQRSGVFLPQVAIETGWDIDTFLSILCTQKAGLSSDSYKSDDVDLFVFQVESIVEAKKE